jgi:hypothetical protein
MAQKFRKVDPRVWDDETFRELGADGQRLCLYLITSPQGNRIGLHKFSLALGAEALGMMPETFAECFKRVIGELEWKYDPGARVLYIPSWWKYNPPENPNVLKGNLDDLHDLPKTELLNEFALNHRWLTAGSSAATDRLRQTFRETLAARYGITYSETGTGTGTESGTGTGNSGEPPSLFGSGNSPPPVGVDDAEIVLTFETVPGAKSDAREWHLTRDKLAEWQSTFPGIDVEAQAREAWQFIRDNPARRTTASGVTDLLRRWFSRAQNQSSNSRAARNTGGTSALSRSDARRERLERAVRK